MQKVKYGHNYISKNFKIDYYVTMILKILWYIIFYETLIRSLLK